jgi:GR25 family glycosyltransferase involved in LPS biosynthesis
MDTVYIRYINLDRRTDRNEDVLKKLISILGFDESNIKRFSAIDGNNLIQDLVVKNYISDELIEIIRAKEINVKAPELACLLSHYFLLKEIVEDKTIPYDSIIFLFEDDFFINEQYLTTIKISDIIEEIKNSEFDKESTWDMIYMGGRFTPNFIPKNKTYFTNIFNNLYKRIDGQGMDWDRTTHNYLVKKSNIKNILKCYLEYFKNQKNQKNQTFQVDSFYNSQSKNLEMFDYFPHIFYSPWNYSTDIQYSKLMINTKDICME